MTDQVGDTSQPIARRAPRTALGWFRRLANERPADYHRSDPHVAHPHPWPAGFDPMTNPVFAHNSLDMPAPASAVFAALIDATAWPAFYPNAADVVVEDGRETRLRPGARFVWRTFSTRQKSEVVLFEPDVSLGWTANSPGTRAFHRWLIEPRAGGAQVNVITEECQLGITARIDRYWMNRSLSAAHQLWLETLRDKVAGIAGKKPPGLR
jgi:Polyketide cyclase / dehydrase and lipid transport